MCFCSGDRDYGKLVCVSFDLPFFSYVLMSSISLAVVRDAMCGGCLPDDICVISSAKAMYSVSCVGGGMSCV